MKTVANIAEWAAFLLLFAIHVLVFKAIPWVVRRCCRRRGEPAALEQTTEPSKEGLQLVTYKGEPAPRLIYRSFRDNEKDDKQGGTG